MSRVEGPGAGTKTSAPLGLTNTGQVPLLCSSWILFSLPKTRLKGIADEGIQKCNPASAADAQPGTSSTEVSPGKNISVRILGDINGHLKRMEMRCSRRPRQVFVSITAKNSSKGCFRFNTKVMIWRTHNAYLGCSRDQKPTHISGYCVRRVNELH